jgi:hypothetical protein
VAPRDYLVYPLNRYPEVDLDRGRNLLQCR